MAFLDKKSQKQNRISIESIQIKVDPIQSEHAIRKQDCLQRSSKVCQKLIISVSKSEYQFLWSVSFHWCNHTSQKNGTV